MERILNNQEIQKVNYPGFERLLKDFVTGDLELNEIQQLAQDNTKITSNPDSWVSVTTRRPDHLEISIGEKKIPNDLIESWRWGADTTEQQYLVKFAHELAHVVQNSFDKSLTNWLDGENEISEDNIPYILLYAKHAESGLIHGLPQMDVYHAQSKTSGRLDMQTYEDVAETISSLLLGEQYFNFRLLKLNLTLTEAQKKELHDLTRQVIDNYKKKKKQ